MIHKGSVQEEEVHSIRRLLYKYSITVYGVLSEYHDYLHISFNEDKKYYDL